MTVLVGKVSAPTSPQPPRKAARQGAVLSADDCEDRKARAAVEDRIVGVTGHDAGIRRHDPGIGRGSLTDPSLAIPSRTLLRQTTSRLKLCDALFDIGAGIHNPASDLTSRIR
jgi:hypothetical protein